MPGKMSLVFVKETGNVLAFGTRVAAPAAFEDIADLEGEELNAAKEKELAELLGSELVVRFDWKPTDPDFNSAKFGIPASELDVLIADTDEAVTGKPRKYYVDGTGKPSAVFATSVTLPTAQSSTKITVEISPDPVSSDTKVWLRVQASNEEDCRIAKGVLQPNVLGGKKVEIAVPELPGGDYLALVAISGFPLFAGKFTI